MNFVEIHFHLLPGIDDGPRSMEESIGLARAAVADGTGTVVATPHVHPAHVTDPTELSARVHELTVVLKAEGVPLKVLSGGEVAHTMVQRLTDAQLEAVAQGPPGKRWVLLEAPFNGLGEHYTAAADELRARGFAVVVGHPERAALTPGSDVAIRRELRAGSMLQLTAWSILGGYGEHTRDRALCLLRSTQQALIASDAHGGDRRPALRPAVEALRAGGEPDAARYASTIPRGLLDNGLRLAQKRLAA